MIFYFTYLVKDNFDPLGACSSVKINFANPKHEELVNDFGALSRKFDEGQQKVADEILATLEVLRSADSLADIPRTYRPHPLDEEDKGLLAVSITRTHSTIFKPNSEGVLEFRIDNYKTITSITVVEIYKAYH
jgi:hypothetical protein